MCIKFLTKLVRAFREALDDMAEDRAASRKQALETKLAIEKELSTLTEARVKETEALANMLTAEKHVIEAKAGTAGIAGTAGTAGNGKSRR
ncbi:MAG: hypothetical protein PHQ43_00750 [Dehalococcoidales bacterium]|nr:hypothetical protein [Dehalococcoidales bacterium]